MQLYVHHDGQQQGPLELELVRARLADGSYQGGDLGWHEGAADWLPLSAIPALAGSAAPPPMPVGAFPPRQMPIHAGQAPQTSGLAIASLVLGLMSVVGGIFTGIPAVICGHLSLSQIKKSAGTITGKGMAITGLVIGYLGICSIVLLLAAIAVPGFLRARDRAMTTQSLIGAKQIAQACKRYAGEHDGNFPAKLDEVVPAYLPDKHLFVCPLGKGGPKSGYHYSGGKDTNAPDQVLLNSEAANNNNQHVVVYADGHGELEPE